MNRYIGPNKADKFIVALYEGNRFWDEELKSVRKAIFLGFSYGYPYPLQFDNLISVYCPTIENAFHLNAGTSQYFVRSDSSKEAQHTLISSWLSKCDTEHGSSCRGEFSTHNLTLLLVDVQNFCLVQAPSSTSFVALSYTWGLDKGGLLFITQKATLDELKTPGALKKLGDRLPRTIRDAIDLLRSLNQDYLWVDSICIVQDDEKQKHDQISAMDRIYCSAKFTIVAMTGKNNNAGLFIPVIPSPELSHETKAALFVKRVSRYTGGETKDWVLDTRGWTFQERLLSKRQVLFIDGDVFFKCQRTTWRQDLAMESSSNVVWNSKSPMSNIQNIFFDPLDLKNDTPWSKYSSIVARYTKRELGFESDIIEALTGVLNVLENEIHSPFILGMPVLLFDLFIMWISIGCERRPGFPSWSWAGWRGRIQPGYISVGKNPKEFLRAHTWIDWTFYDTKTNRFVPLQSLLQGPNTPVTMRQAYDNYLSDFASDYLATDLPQAVIWKPGATRFQDLPTHKSPLLKLYNPSQHPCALSGFTASAFLRFTQAVVKQEIDDVLHSYLQRDSTMKYVISDVSGQVVGELKDHTGMSKLNLPDLEGIQEVLILSDYYDSTDGVWDMFNVMVVQEVGGILCRLAIARVKHECLEKSFPPGARWREFILG